MQIMSESIVIYTFRTAMSGSSPKPYILRWSREQYEKLGGELGFGFSRHEFDRAQQNGRVLGVRRYLPISSNAPKLGIPPGAFVQCCLTDG